jgi:hypothetical protein
MFPSWESAGAGRVGLAAANIQSFIFLQALCSKIIVYGVFKIKTMKKYNLLSIILLAVTLTNCGDTKKVKIFIYFR